MAVGDRKDAGAPEDVGVERAQRAERDHARVQRVPMRPELRATVERLIRRNRVGLEYLAEH